MRTARLAAGRRPGRSCRQGSALVEFVIILPALLILLLLGPDICMMTYAKVVLHISARDAARALAIGAGPSAAEQQANDNLSMGAIPTGAVRWDVTDQGDWVTVRLSYDRPVWVPGLPILVGQAPWAKTVPLSGSATFRKRG